jgi:hypothetical protein
MKRIIVITIAVLIMLVTAVHAQWTTPEERVYFGGGMGSIQQTVNGRDIDCPLVYQDVAYKLDKDNKRTEKITVSAYGGVAFIVPEKIEVQKDSEMRAEVKIEIEGVEKGIFLTKKGDKAAVPFLQISGGLDPNCTMFRNVVWVFTKKMEFSTEKERFTVNRPGATISFTKDGVKLDGITKVVIGIDKKGTKK